MVKQNSTNEQKNIEFSFSENIINELNSNKIIVLLSATKLVHKKPMNP